MINELQSKLKELAASYKQIIAAKTTELQSTAANGRNNPIKNSVGKGGKNDKADVLTVQELLNKFGYKLTVDGDCGNKSIAAITDFQVKHAGLAKGDGRIDAGGNTWKKLSAGAGSTTPVTPTPTPETNNGGGKLVKPKWVSVAEGEIGVAEKAGAKHNPRIIEYHATTGGWKDDETPWCSSFVNWVMKQAGITGTNSGSAKSWGTWGQSSKDNQPAYGAVCVKTRKGGGHVGIVVGKKGAKILVLGGNQGDKVCVLGYDPKAFYAYRFPSGYTIPDNAYMLSEGESGGDASTEG